MQGALRHFCISPPAVCYCANGNVYRWESDLRQFGDYLCAFAVVALLVLSASWATAQDSTAVLGDDTASTQETGPRMRPVRTDSPRDTLATFLWLRGELEDAILEYGKRRTTAGAQQLILVGERMRALLDLSQVASSSRDEVGNDTIAVLLDIFGRLELAGIDQVPDADSFDDESLAQYRIPRTPIRITRIDEGPREGEFLFNSRTVCVPFSTQYLRRNTHGSIST